MGAHCRTDLLWMHHPWRKFSDPGSGAWRSFDDDPGVQGVWPGIRHTRSSVNGGPR